MAEKLKELSRDSPMLNSIKIHGTNILDLLFDYNSLEAINLLFCSLILNIGIMFEGLRSIETNANGFEFLGVSIQQSSASMMTTEWNEYFVKYLETCSWFMFVFFFTTCVMSIIIDVIRKLMIMSFFFYKK
jgi:hypothetical protein